MALLAPGIPEGTQSSALQALQHIEWASDAGFQAIVSAGAIPPLAALLGPGTSALLLDDAASFLVSILCPRDRSQIEADVAVGIIQHIAALLQQGSVREQKKAEWMLDNIASMSADRVSQMIVAGALPPLVTILRGAAGDQYVQSGAADVLFSVAYKNNQAIVDAGAVPPLVALLGPEYSAAVHGSAANTLANLASPENAVSQAWSTVIAAGAIPLLVELLRPGHEWDDHLAAAKALASIAGVNNINTWHPGARDLVVAAGAIPLLTSLVSQNGIRVDILEETLQKLSAII